MTQLRWIWLDARYSPSEAAHLCRTRLSAVQWALSEGRLAVGADGLIQGLVLFGWYVSKRRINEGV